jgi:hypothetical protein
VEALLVTSTVAEHGFSLPFFSVSFREQTCSAQIRDETLSFVQAVQALQDGSTVMLLLSLGIHLTMGGSGRDT